MKQKIIYIVLVVVSMHLSASPKECGTCFHRVVTKNVSVVKEKPAVATEGISSLPASPFSRSLFNL